MIHVVLMAVPLDATSAEGVRPNHAPFPKGTSRREEKPYMNKTRNRAKKEKVPRDQLFIKVS